MAKPLPLSIHLDPDEPGTHPRLKLFLSADIIGSTAYKQPLDMRSSKDLQKTLDWSRIIQAFYKVVVDSFQKHWDGVSQAPVQPGASPVNMGSRPVFWKTIGDEVVFWKELTGDLQIWLAFSCWMKTIADVRSYFKSQNAHQLDVKSTAWMAGFPIRNKAVPVTIGGRSGSPRDHLNRFYRGVADDDASVIGDVDFIGPGIDVGFRLSQFSSSKKMSVSLDCAYFLALTHGDILEFQKSYPEASWSFFPLGTGTGTGTASQKFEERLSVFFSGNEPLKGVLGGIHYPKFWINTLREDSLDAAKDQFYRESRKRVEWANLLDYCSKFYADRAQFIAEPFIVSNDSRSKSSIPKTYPAYYRAYLKTVRPQ
jgi:hypothetical protein